jgi:hypothetical protein
MPSVASPQPPGRADIVRSSHRHGASAGAPAVALARDQAAAVVLDLMNSLRAERRL